MKLPNHGGRCCVVFDESIADVHDVYGGRIRRRPDRRLRGLACIHRLWRRHHLRSGAAGRGRPPLSGARTTPGLRRRPERPEPRRRVRHGGAERPGHVHEVPGPAQGREHLVPTEVSGWNQSHFGRQSAPTFAPKVPGSRPGRPTNMRLGSSAPRGIAVLVRTSTRPVQAWARFSRPLMQSSCHVRESWGCFFMAKIAFGGKIGDDWRTSEPWWPPLPTPPDGALNVVLVVLDDVGFAQLGCYGSDIDTPVIDGLAADGIRLTNFHTTALCSPTRACLLTGRNHHRSGMGRVADLAIGFPGYWGRPPRENGFLSEILRANGYATYAVGKWHLSPEEETNMAAPRLHLAPRARIRPVVRVPRRGDAPVRARSLPRQPQHPARACFRGRVPLERRPR